MFTKSVVASKLGFSGDYLKNKGAANGNAESLGNGCYLINRDSTADGYPNSWGVILSFDSGNGQGIQFSFDASVDEGARALKWRSKWDNVWSAWKLV